MHGLVSKLGVVYAADEEGREADDEAHGPGNKSKSSEPGQCLRNAQEIQASRQSYTVDSVTFVVRVDLLKECIEVVHVNPVPECLLVLV